MNIADCCGRRLVTLPDGLGNCDVKHKGFAVNVAVPHSLKSAIPAESMPLRVVQSGGGATLTASYCLDPVGIGAIRFRITQNRAVQIRF